MGGLIWLASYPKSGNTWLRSFLHNLLMNTEEPVPPDELTRFCIGEANAAHYRKRVGVAWDKVTPADIARVRVDVQKDFTFASSDSVFVKSHNYLGPWLGHPLFNMNVTAGAIYVLRNPLDVVLSAREHFGLDLPGAIKMLRDPGSGSPLSDVGVPEVYTTWSNHVRSWTANPNPQLLVLRYEDMLAKPTEVFGSVAQFLGLDPPRERLERAIENSSFKKLKSLESTTGFKEKSHHAESFFRKGEAGQWREELTEKQVREIIADHRIQMQRFGYIPEDYA